MRIRIPEQASHRFIRLVQPAGQKNRDLSGGKISPVQPGPGRRNGEGGESKGYPTAPIPAAAVASPARHRPYDSATPVRTQNDAAGLNEPAGALLWGPQLRLPTFVAPFRTPGNQAAPTQARTLNAPPKLQAPTLEPPDISTQTPLDSLSKLSARFPSTLPVRTSEDAVSWSAASADPTPGDPTALLSRRSIRPAFRSSSASLRATSSDGHRKPQRPERFPHPPQARAQGVMPPVSLLAQPVRSIQEPAPEEITRQAPVRIARNPPQRPKPPLRPANRCSRAAP